MLVAYAIVFFQIVYILKNNVVFQFFNFIAQNLAGIVERAQFKIGLCKGLHLDDDRLACTELDKEINDNFD